MWSGGFKSIFAQNSLKNLDLYLSCEESTNVFDNGDESKKKFLWFRPPIVYGENESGALIYNEELKSHLTP